MTIENIHLCNVSSITQGRGKKTKSSTLSCRNSRSLPPQLVLLQGPGGGSADSEPVDIRAASSGFVPRSPLPAPPCPPSVIVVISLPRQPRCFCFPRPGCARWALCARLLEEQQSGGARRGQQRPLTGHGRLGHEWGRENTFFLQTAPVFSFFF